MQVVLTADGLYFGKVGTDKLIDQIPLLEILRVDPADVKQQKVKEDRQRKKRPTSFSKGTASPHLLHVPFGHREPSDPEAHASQEVGEPAPEYSNEDEKELTCTFTIEPCKEGLNSGRASTLRASSAGKRGREIR